MSKRTYTSKRERFLEAGAARTQAVIEKIRVLGNCSNPSLYDYNPEEVEKIFRAIQSQLLTTKARFTKKRTIKFKL